MLQKSCHPERAWCSAQRIKINMIAGGNHTIMQRESKDLGTNLIANVDVMRRFFDSALRAPLRMTGLSFHSTALQTTI